MLLESVDSPKNEILIYSENKFDFNENFKIIFTGENQKTPHKITFTEVANIIREPFNKNLILYRILCNVSGIDIYNSKYGYFLNLQGKLDLFYFDPVFAINDLEYLNFNLDPENFRFKIQQVGLSTFSIQDEEIVFTEVFCFDLRASEAQNQNDRVFADALFVFEESYENYSDSVEDVIIDQPKYLSANITPVVHKDNIIEVDASGVIVKEIEKIEDLKNVRLFELHEKKIAEYKSIKEEKPAPEVVKVKSEFSLFLEKNRKQNYSFSGDENPGLVNKVAVKKTDKQDSNYILKFNKNEK